MRDAIIEELRNVKDSLSQGAARDLRAFCNNLNESARDRGVQLVNRSSYAMQGDSGLPSFKVAEESDITCDEK